MHIRCREILGKPKLEQEFVELRQHYIYVTNYYRTSVKKLKSIDEKVNTHVNTTCHKHKNNNYGIYV